MQATGYKVPSTKMKSRFGISHADARYINKRQAEVFGGNGKHYNTQLSKRRAKLCTHPNMRDEGHANSESGSIDLCCKRCGYSYHVALY